MKTLPGCEARQYSDQMQCRCGLCWDMNDPEPPQCGKMRPPVPSARERVLEQVGLSDPLLHPIAKSGEQQFACILRNRSGQSAGEIDFGARSLVELGKSDQKDAIDSVFAVYEKWKCETGLAAARDVTRVSGARIEQLETLLRDLLQSGEWYASALEFDQGVDGEALRARVEAALL